MSAPVGAVCFAPGPDGLQCTLAIGHSGAHYSRINGRAWPNYLDRRLDVMNPSLALLSKLGSIARHCEEEIDKEGHTFDLLALRCQLSDPELADWMKGMDEMALLPAKR